MNNNLLTLGISGENTMKIQLWWHEIFPPKFGEKTGLAANQRFGGRFGGRDVGFKKRVAILGIVNFRSMNPSH